MKKILITGFEPFDQDSENPSAVFLEYLNFKMKNNDLGFQVFTCLLPVVFDRSYQILKDKIVEFSPDLIIETGYAKNRSKLTVEKIGINWIDARIPDNDGVQPRESKIIANDSDGIFCKINLEKALRELNSSEFEISLSAGSYVCNELYYRTLSDKNPPCTFIHLPGQSKLNQDEIFNLICKFIELI